MLDTATYVYCVVCRDRPATLTRVSGLPGASRPMMVRIAPRMFLVASEVPLDRYGPDTVDRRLRDLDWVAEIALAHETVVERITRIRGATVIPMKLFTMFSRPDRAVEELGRRRRDLVSVAKRIRGCEEWGVRMTRAAGVVRGTQPTASGRSGVAFLMARKRERDETRAHSMRQAAAAEEAVQALERIARQAKRRSAPEGAPTQPLVDAAFLVPQSRRARFKSSARQAAIRCRAAGVDLTLTGPWPAYNFIESSDAEKDAS
jgi:hypothetical protein